MSFVGTRPEVTKYVKKYTNEMRATLLLPAGITSERRCFMLPIEEKYLKKLANLMKNYCVQKIMNCQTPHRNRNRIRNRSGRTGK